MSCWSVQSSVPFRSAARSPASWRRHSELPAYRAWLHRALAEEPTVGYSDVVLNGVVRVVTHPRLFNKPSSLEAALGFVDFIRNHPRTVATVPGSRHWTIFAELCRTSNARGNLVPDAYHAALAIEHGAIWATADRHFARFPRLQWRHPLDAQR